MPKNGAPRRRFFPSISVSPRRRAAAVLALAAFAAFNVTLLTYLSRAAGEVTFTTTSIPVSEGELTNPNRGLFYWGEGSPAEWYQGADRGGEALYVYDRFTLRDIMTGGTAAAPTYNWAPIDRIKGIAESRKGKWGFRIMTGFTGSRSPSAVPDFLMGSGMGYYFNDNGSNYWTPDWNNGIYLSTVERFWKDFAARYGSSPSLGMMEYGFHGNWGEWHHYPYRYPVTANGGTYGYVTDANQQRIVDAAHNALPQAQWIAMKGDFITQHGNVHAMNKGAGWRTDNAGQGSTSSIPADLPRFWAKAQDQWKVAPVLFEPSGFGHRDPMFTTIDDHVLKYHAAAIANGNAFDSNYLNYPQADRANWMRAVKMSGYRYELNSVTLPGMINRGTQFALASRWSNKGVAPAYDRWDVTYELRNASGAIAWSGKSALSLKTLLPTGTSQHAQNDTFVVPNTVAAGTYTLAVRVKDPNNYMNPMKLAISGRQADGSYHLGRVSLDSGAGTHPVPANPTPANPTPAESNPADPTPASPGAAIQQTGNLAGNKTFVSSVGHAGGASPALVNNGNEADRWISVPGDNVTIGTDLGAAFDLSNVSILWAGDTTKDYEVQVSGDGRSWRTAASGQTNNTPSQAVHHTLSSANGARYVRILTRSRWNSAYGNSIFELGIYGTPAGAAPAPRQGDLNGDGKVAITDLSILLSKWGTGDTGADLNRDGTVSITDLSILLSRWTG